MSGYVPLKRTPRPFIDPFVPPTALNYQPFFVGDWKYLDVLMAYADIAAGSSFIEILFYDLINGKFPSLNVTGGYLQVSDQCQTCHKVIPVKGAYAQLLQSLTGPKYQLTVNGENGPIERWPDLTQQRGPLMTTANGLAGESVASGATVEHIQSYKYDGEADWVMFTTATQYVIDIRATVDGLAPPPDYFVDAVRTFAVSIPTGPRIIRIPEATTCRLHIENHDAGPQTFFSMVTATEKVHYS